MGGKLLCETFYMKWVRLILKPFYVKTLRSGATWKIRLASANIGHDPVVELAGEMTCLTDPEHFACGQSAVRGAARDGVDGQPMVSHSADDDGSIATDFRRSPGGGRLRYRPR